VHYNIFIAPYLFSIHLCVCLIKLSRDNSFDYAYRYQMGKAESCTLEQGFAVIGAVMQDVWHDSLCFICF
jgi:hypothetical protein